MSSPEKSSFHQVDGDCGTCDHPLAVHLGPSNTGKCCWDFCTCPGRVAGPLATAADRLWDYCWPLAGDEGAPPKPAFRRALRNVLNGQPPAAVVSSSPATPEGGRGDWREFQQRCREDTLCTLPDGNHEQHYDCRDGAFWRNFAYAAPSPASPAETREGLAARRPLPEPQNEREARWFSVVIDRYDPHAAMALADAEIAAALAASPAVSLPGEQPGGEAR